MRLRSAGSLVTSVLLHAGVLASGAWLLSRSLASDASASKGATLVEVALVDDAAGALPGSTFGEVVGVPVPTPAPEPREPPPNGGERMPRPDLERIGRGGEPTGAHALNLAASIDDVTLEREIINALHRSQTQRLQTSDKRMSVDDRRATPEPMTMTFVASGEGARAERRPVARFEPSRGELGTELPRSRGGTLGGPRESNGVVATTAAGAVQEGSRSEQPSAAGITDGARDRDARASAAVTLARPLVPPARAALPTETRGRPNDIVDSPQEVATPAQSVLDASTAGGERGADRGGERGAGRAGAGAPGTAGSRSEAAGFGPGPRRAASDDPRVTSYFREMVNRVDWQRAFPSWAIADGRGGVAVVGATVLADGRVTDVRILRASGIAEFDRNLVDAVQRAAPFGPLPKSVGSSVRVSMSFDALNPAVGRIGPGRGRAARR